MSLSVEQINNLQQENERLAKEVAQWKHEYEMLDACCELYSAKLKEPKAENDRLKEEVETRDNLVEHFRKEAINWAKISNDCIKDIEKYKQTLQEIKAIVCCNYEIIDAQGRKDILKLITKTEEE